MIQVSAGQSLLDVALQACGSAAAAYALATANGLAITDPLTPGQQLLVPPVTAPTVVGYFAGRLQRINTGDEVAASTTPAPVIYDHHPLDYHQQDYA